MQSKRNKDLHNTPPKKADGVGTPSYIPNPWDKQVNGEMHADIWVVCLAPAGTSIFSELWYTLRSCLVSMCPNMTKESHQWLCYRCQQIEGKNLSA